MSWIPTRFLMTDNEKDFFYGNPNHPFKESRYEEVERTMRASAVHDIFVSDTLIEEHHRYAEALRQIESRTPDYRAIAKNLGLEFIASSIESLSFPLRLGGISVSFDNLRQRKVLPYMA